MIRFDYDTPPTHKSSFLGSGHLDSFLRDTFFAGKNKVHPADWIEKLHFRGNYIETDLETAVQLTNTIIEDHIIFLDPYSIAMDALLSKVVLLLCEEERFEKESIQSMVDRELIRLAGRQPFNSNTTHYASNIMEAASYSVMRCRRRECIRD